MKLYARHIDGKISIWDLEESISYREARRLVNDAVEKETGSVPNVVLTLVTANFK